MGIKVQWGQDQEGRKEVGVEIEVVEEEAEVEVNIVMPHVLQYYHLERKT